MTPRQHLDTLGLLFVIWGCITLFFGALAIAFLVLGGLGMGVAGATGGDQDLLIASGMYAAGAVLTAVIIVVVGIPYVAVGMALRRRRSWARIGGLVLGVIALMNFPLGTILGVYAIVKLIDPEVRALLEAGDTSDLG